MGYKDPRYMVVQPSQAIRKADQHYKCEVPMDLILKRLTECQRLGRLYNPDAFYVESREMFVDWMCDLSRTRVKPAKFKARSARATTVGLCSARVNQDSGLKGACASRACAASMRFSQTLSGKNTLVFW